MILRLRDLTQSIVLNMGVEDAIKHCAKVVNSTKGYALKDYDVDNGSITYFYVKGIFKIVEDEDAYMITFVFHDDGCGNTICTGSVCNRWNEYNPFVVWVLVFHRR